MVARAFIGPLRVGCFLWALLHYSLCWSTPDSLQEFRGMRQLAGKGRFIEAASTCEKLIRQYPDRSVLYETYAELAQYNGRLADALQFLDRAIDNGGRVASCSFGQGCVYMRLRRYDAALLAFQRAHLLGMEEPRTTKGLAYAYEKVHGTRNAVAHFTVLSQRNPSRSDWWYALSLLFWGKGDYSRALAAALKALDLDPRNLQYRIAVVGLKYALFQTESGHQEITRLIADASEANDFESVGLLRSLLVRTLIQSGHYDAALDQTRTLLSEMLKIGHHRWIGWSYLRLSDIDVERADYTSSLDNTKKAIASAHRSGDTDLEYEAEVREFDACMELGLLREALTNAQSRLRRVEDEVSASHVEALTDNARVYLDAGEYEGALEYGIRAVVLLDRTTPDRAILARLHSTLGQIYLGLNQVKEARYQLGVEERIINELPYSVRDVAALLGNKGNCFVAEGRWGEAQQAFLGELELAGKAHDQRERAYALINLGNCSRLRAQWGQAREYYLSALHAGETYSLSRVIVQSAHGLSLIAEHFGLQGEMLTWLNRSIVAWQKMNWLARTGLLGVRGVRGVSEDFEKLISQLVLQHRTAEAFLVSENFNRSTELLIPGSSPPSVGEDIMPGRIQRVNRRSGNANSLESEDLAFFMVAEDTLNLADPAGADPGCRGEAEAKQTVERIRRENLPDSRTAILEYFIGRHESFVFVLRQDTLCCIPVPADQKKIKESIAGVGTFLESSPVQSAAMVGRSYFNGDIADTLCRLLVGTTLPLLRSADRMLVVRGIHLEMLPFEMLLLPRTPDEKGGVAANRFLVGRFECDYKFSLFHARRVPAKRSGGGAFMCAIDDGSSQGSGGHAQTVAPRAGSELRWLQVEFGDLGVRVADSSASGPALVDALENAEVIHVAGHSWYAGSGDQRIGMPDEREDDSQTFCPFQMWDVLRMHLSAQLVVLSSCRTARPPEVLSRMDFVKSFLVAGAGSAVGSLWEADDECTERLMRSFYRNLKAGMNKGRALQQAKLELIREGKTDPYLWAPFILFGNDEPISFPHHPDMLQLKILGSGVVFLLFVWAGASATRVMSPVSPVKRATAKTRV
jgi:tetratricopeptide (TPR) repeat protein